tara:strand:+ start:6548 stop:7051 length:504 start_codon:yes stop_codon:yes gene_type:complete
MLKKITALFISFATFIACNDGGLEVENIDFNGINISYCGTLDLEEQLLFKLNDREALILELPNAFFTLEEKNREYTIPSAAQLTYRIFDEKVTTTYFCSLIPEITPNVVNSYEAIGGKLLATSTLNSETNRYDYIIELQEVSFALNETERITNLSIEEFGTLSFNTN